MGINGGRYVDSICQGEAIGGEAPHLQQDASHDYKAVVGDCIRSRRKMKKKENENNNESVGSLLSLPSSTPSHMRLRHEMK